MFKTLYAIILAAGLVMTPLSVAVAQSNPTANMGSNKSSTASPGTADSATVPGMHTSDAGALSAKTGAAMSSTKPGATGQSVVKGTASTPAGTAAGTAEQKTGGTVSGGGGGGK